jgi:hypothetical protein
VQWHGGETKAPYDGKYGIPMSDVMSARPLLALLSKAGFDPEMPIEIGPVNPDHAGSGIIPLSLPCCKPLDEKSLLGALDEAGLVGEKGIIGRDGTVREGYALIFFDSLPTRLDEESAPGFGDRRKDVRQVLVVRIGPLTMK